MRYAATMTFDFEADSPEQAMERLRGLQRKITRASQRLGIGFRQGVACAQPQPGPAAPIPQECPDAEPEALFDA